MKCFVFIILVFSYANNYCLANSQVIRYIQSDGVLDHRHEYFIKLLRLALDKGAKDADSITLQPADIYMSQSRSFHQLINNSGIDIIWNGTSIAREKDLLPIRIPLIKGILGYRVLIINKKNKDRFSYINNVEELRNYTAGQGYDWPDTKILKANQLDVMTASTYHGLFQMLLSERFDYFPRGINEAWQELESYSNEQLMIDEHIVLHYTFPVYFFVNKNNKKLADSIEQGLKIAKNDGSFEQLFATYYQPDRLLGSMPVEKRLIIHLDNPLLPPLTPINNKSLWYTLP